MVLEKNENKIIFGFFHAFGFFSRFGFFSWFGFFHRKENGPIKSTQSGANF